MLARRAILRVCAPKNYVGTRLFFYRIFYRICRVPRGIAYFTELLSERVPEKAARKAMTYALEHEEMSYGPIRCPIAARQHAETAGVRR
jgi:hypothetical protein